MSFRTKIQPIVRDRVAKVTAFPPTQRQMPKSRLTQLFEQQFNLTNLSGGDQSDEFEPSSVCLRKLVQNYMEDPDSGKQWCGGRNNCNSCSSDDSSDEEEEEDSGGLLQSVKNLLLCANISEEESNLVTKTTEIIEKNNHNSKMQTLVDGLVALGYDAAICKSRRDKSRKSVCFPGEYEYVDVMIRGERVLIDIDFNSKFKIARPTKAYKSISQTLPYVFVGKMDRLQKVVVVVSKAVKKSMKKKGLLVPPWRRAKYVLTKWLASYVRGNQTQEENSRDIGVQISNEK